MDLSPLRDLPDRWLLRVARSVSNLQRREIVVGSGHSAGEPGISHVCPNCGGGMAEGEELGR